MVNKDKVEYEYKRFNDPDFVLEGLVVHDSVLLDRLDSILVTYEKYLKAVDSVRVLTCFPVLGEVDNAETPCAESCFKMVHVLDVA